MFLIAVYYRTNFTMRQVAVLFGVSTVGLCRVIQRLGSLLALDPVPRPQGADERLWIVDGMLVPVRGRRIAASSRNYRFSANVQVIVDATPASRWPRPGRCQAHARAWRGSGLAPSCEGVTVLGDGPASARD